MSVVYRNSTVTSPLGSGQKNLDVPRDPVTGAPKQSDMAYDRFFQTQSAQNKFGTVDPKYGNYYLNFLRKAQMTNDGRFYIPKGAMGNGGNLFFGSRGPNGEDYLGGDSFVQLQKDYGDWMKQTQKSDSDYASYVAYMRSNGGRDSTMFASSQKPVSTPFGVSNSGGPSQTVFG